MVYLDYGTGHAFCLIYLGSYKEKIDYSRMVDYGELTG
jgi:hypothetical protein